MLPIFADLQTCKDCSKLLMSSNMHAHKEFYSHFVAALASGRMCNIKKQPVLTPLPEFISIDHEAHFRLEMWYCLNKQGKCISCPSFIFTSLLSILSFCLLHFTGYRHECRDSYQAARARNFEAMRKKVKRDRRKNNEEAEKARQGTNHAIQKSKEEQEKLEMGSGAINSDEDDDDDESDDE
jgi:hypothetical protein